VQFTDLGESIALQLAGEPDECGPEPPMHIGNLPVHKPSDEHIRRIPHETSQRKDLMALWVTPPVSANALASRRIGEWPLVRVPTRERSHAARHTAARFRDSSSVPMTLLTHAQPK
jgi:hypothetical protein